MLNVPEHYPETLADLAVLLHERLAQHLDPARAAAVALALAEDVRRKWGGGAIYIPRGDSFERTRRDSAVWRDFNGRNYVELARKYDCTVKTIYEIVDRERERRQQALFS
mgnify:FL=1